MKYAQAWCHRILEGLLAAGVRSLIVSPGSRSTPMLLAAIEAPIELYSVIDERSAAFFALGRARATANPVALLCTSGSAGAHYLPALLEARYSGHSVIAITADRPPELQNCGANQTIDQRQLFAAACPPCLDVGITDDHPTACAAVRRRVHETIVLASGPIHINVPFRKPLEPPERELPDEILAPPVQPVYAPKTVVVDRTLSAIATHCNRSQRTLIVAGPATSTHQGAAVLALAEATGAIVLAEGASGARFTGTAQPLRCDGFPHILEESADLTPLAPDLVLQVGAEPCSASLNRWLRSLDAHHIRFCENHPLNMPTGTAQVVIGDFADCSERLRHTVEPSQCDAFTTTWRHRDIETWTTVETQLLSTAQPFSEAQAMAQVLANLPRDCQMTIGNSLPIRCMDMVCPGHHNALRILHQRGTSGIDGLIAGAIGSAGSAPSALILGDVSCSHDLSSLALASASRGPLTIICLDNQGGQIFSHLPVAQHPITDEAWQFWQTCPATDLEAACQAYGVLYQQAKSGDELATSLRWALQQLECVFIHVVVSANGLQNFMTKVRARLQQVAS